MSAALSLQEAADLMHSVKQGRSSLYESFPKLDYKIFEQCLAAELLGVYDQYKPYAEQNLRYEKIRNACRLIAAYNTHVDPTQMEWAKDLAALSMGCVHCQELTTAMFLQAFARGRPVARLILGDGDPLSSGGHALLISGDSKQITEAYKEDEDVARFIQKLKGCLLIDPYLNIICEAEQVASSGLYKYLVATGFKKVLGMEYIPAAPDSEFQFQALALLSEKVKEAALNILEKPINTNMRIEGLKRVLGVPSGWQPRNLQEI